MEDNRNPIPEEEAETAPKLEDIPAKTLWQMTKESWYDKVPLTLKQLDWIIGVCLFLLVLTFLAICLDSMGIFHLFGN